MTNELIMNVTVGETRIARLEDGQVSELFIERDDEEQVVGSIYKGVVNRVLPGMQAAFVDIGLEKATFLYVSDVVPDIFEDDEEEEEESEAVVETAVEPGTETDASAGGTGAGEKTAEGDGKPKVGAPKGSGGGRRLPRRRQKYNLPKIEDLLKEGQQVVVQVAKAPIRTKGARVTCHVSFPGRFIVFMPSVDHVGVSRRISTREERVRLRKIMNDGKPGKGGYIARTVCTGAEESALVQDMKNVYEIWEKIAVAQETAKAPSLLYRDLGLVLRSVRDLMSSDVDRLVIDSKEDYNEIMAFMDKFMPDLAGRVELYEGESPLFDVYGIETEINRALSKKIWLKSGGYLVVDQNEALTSIDVNTGRFVGRDNFEDTILKTNLEAATEIAYQLRLRNIGGIIINDFIDMERHANRNKVFYALKDALRKDKTRSTITKISELGLVEMTRKRTRESLTQTLSENCFYCQGRGRIKTPMTVAFELFRELRRTVEHLTGKSIVVHVHPTVARVLFNELRKRLDNLEKKCGKRIIVEAAEALHVEKFTIATKG